VRLLSPSASSSRSHLLPWAPAASPSHALPRPAPPASQGGQAPIRRGAAPPCGTCRASPPPPHSTTSEGARRRLPWRPTRWHPGFQAERRPSVGKFCFFFRFSGIRTAAEGGRRGAAPGLGDTDGELGIRKGNRQAAAGNNSNTQPTTLV